MSRFIARSGALIVAGSLFLAGCANPIVASVEPTPTAVPTPLPPSLPTFAVTRGSITDVIQATGRVVAVQQQDLYFRIDGNLDNIYVNVQDKVTKGQVLASLDTSTLKKQIARDQAVLDGAKLDLQKAQVTMNNANLGTDQDIKSADAGVLSAQAAYDSANAKLQALTNPTDADVAKAQATLASARAGLVTSQLKLQALQAGAPPADQQKAAAAVAAAQAAVTVAKEKLAEVQGGPTPTDIALAKAKLQSAQDAFNAAKATYLAFQNGPTAVDQQKTQLAVTQAKNALYAAQVSRDSACAKVNVGIGQAECNAANAGVNTAQSNLDAAQQALNQLGTVSPTDKMKADAAYQQAQADLTAAQAAYTSATQAAQPADIAQAKDAVAQAEAGLQQALAAQAGLAPTANQIDQAKQDVASAQAGVDAAAAALQAVTHTSPEAIRQQQDAVAQAAAALSQAQNNAAKVRALAGAGNTNTIDLAIYQKKIDQAQLQLAEDNDQLAQMQVVAPFDGIVIATNGQAGDRVNAYTAVVTVANPEQLQIAVSVPQDQLQKVVVGQQAQMLMDAFPGKTVAGTVSQLPAVSNETSSGTGSPDTSATPAPQGTVVDTSPKITPNWPGPGAQLGQLARVTIIVQKKDNVLKIPTNTVNKINNRTFVMLDDHGRQKPVDIQIGIQTDTETEVISGLTVGEKVFTRSL